MDKSTFIALWKADGFIDAQEKCWMEGIAMGKSERHWCVLRSVLHWVKWNPR